MGRCAILSDALQGAFTSECVQFVGNGIAQLGFPVLMDIERFSCVYVRCEKLNEWEGVERFGYDFRKLWEALGQVTTIQLSDHVTYQLLISHTRT